MQTETWPLSYIYPAGGLEGQLDRHCESADVGVEHEIAELRGWCEQRHNHLRLLGV